MNYDFLISGAISGAITDPNSEAALNHAELYYNEIRKLSTDVTRIAKNLGKSYEQILLVKNYLFMNAHNLNGEVKLFDPSFEIAESWRRLAFDEKNIQPHDILLIEHELYEMELVSKGHSQSDAHDITNKLYNYTLASRKYYNTLAGKKDEEIVTSNNTTISGGITKESRLDYRTH